jgi:CheY-like chemotaxis protein
MAREPEPTAILVVDPDPAERELMIAACKAAAAEIDREVVIDQAADGTTALAIWSEKRPRVVVAEVVLEGLSGFALVRRILAGDDAVCVVLVTSMAREADRYWGLRLGALAYLGKPYDEAQLRTWVRKAMTDGRKARPLVS